MTKVRRTVNFSMELDGILALLASTSQQNLSEFLEYRLREIPEVQTLILKQRTADDPVAMVKGKIPYPIHDKSKPLAI